MEYFETIKKRCSVRAYKSDEVEKEKLGMVLEAGRLAPTAVNFQPFKILVISTKGKEEELKKIYKQDWFSQPPFIIGVCSIPEKAWVRRDNKNYSDVDASIVMDHMILAATDLGLGTCWVGAFNVDAAREVLNIEESWEPIAFTPLGYAKEDAVPRNKKPIEDIVVYM